MNDLTVIYYTADFLPEKFAKSVKQILLDSIGDLPIVEIHQPKETPRSHFQIYRNALEGAKKATTKYIAIAEDDVLYTPEHFKHRPKSGVFEYNKCVWSIYTWVKPAIFSYKDRRNMYSLICERELFIEAMEERFAKWPDDSKTDFEIWAEPGKYEDHLRVTKRKSAIFYTDIPLVAFSHETALSFLNLGKRKALGFLKTTEIPYWNNAEDILKLYE